MTILAFLVALIGSIEYLCVRIKKWLKRALKDEIEPLKSRINDLELALTDITPLLGTLTP